jgi:hypothetical protein
MIWKQAHDINTSLGERGFKVKKNSLPLPQQIFKLIYHIFTLAIEHSCIKTKYFTGVHSWKHMRTSRCIVSMDGNDRSTQTSVSCLIWIYWDIMVSLRDIA